MPVLLIPWLLQALLPGSRLRDGEASRGFIRFFGDREVISCGGGEADPHKAFIQTPRERQAEIASQRHPRWSKMTRPFYPTSLLHPWTRASPGAGATWGKATLESGADSEGRLLPALPVLGQGAFKKGGQGATRRFPHSYSLVSYIFILFIFFNK